MPQPCKFPSHDSCQERFLWIHKGVDVTTYTVVDLVLHVGDAEKFPQALGFEGLDLFLIVSEQGPCFTAIEEDGGDNRLAELEHACEADGVAPPNPV